VLTGHAVASASGSDGVLRAVRLFSPIPLSSKALPCAIHRARHLRCDGLASERWLGAQQQPGVASRPASFATRRKSSSLSLPIYRRVFAAVASTAFFPIDQRWKTAVARGWRSLHTWVRSSKSPPLRAPVASLKFTVSKSSPTVTQQCRPVLAGTGEL